jgi:riboflavin kinase/FMN adenylyltransferase
VVPGDKLGRRLGFPTANVARSFCQVDPPDGVYAGAFTIRGATHASAVSIGVRPTVAGLDRRIEAYCLDYSGSEFYGEFGRLNLFRWLHPQKAYESLEVLRENIERDVAEVRSITHSRRQNASIAS